MCLRPYANSKGTDQPAHLRSLLSAFVVRCLVISLDSIAEISRLYLDSIVEQASLSLTWSETPEDMFCHGVAQWQVLYYKSVISYSLDAKMQ